LNTLLRKLKKERQAKVVVGKITINQATRRAKVSDSDVDLNRKEYNLLLYFLKNRNKVLTREQILSSLWGYDFEGDERTVDTHIKTLRAKLSECGGYIKTARGIGYILEVEKS